MSPLPHLTLTEIADRTIDLGWQAAQLLRSYYNGDRDLEIIKQDVKSPITIADRAVDKLILEGLQALCGDSCGYLTEETYQEGCMPLPQEWVWIVDPLDGTRDFIDRTDEYAIHIALVYRHRPVLSVVAIPEAELIYYAIAGLGAFRVTKDHLRTQIQLAGNKPIEDLKVITTRSYLSDRLRQLLAQLPCKTHYPVGSIGCKIAKIIEGEANVYISLSGTSAPKDWDLAAPELILLEAGGKFSHAQGQALMYNRSDVSQWGCLVADDGQWHDRLLAAIVPHL
jgi:3'(2'), 5'-bisphosphate nucleotidase